MMGIQAEKNKTKKKKEEKKAMTGDDLKAKLKKALDEKVLASVMQKMKEREEEKKL